MALILLIPLVVASCGTKPTPVVSATAVSSEPPTQASTETPMETPTAALSTAAPVVANGQEPPPCTFPLAQIATTESAPENYTFSEPKVVLTAQNIGYYEIVQWLPDNQQVLISEVVSGKAGPVELRELYNPETGDQKIYAAGSITNQPSAWFPQLNAVVYPDFNFLGVDPNTNQPKFSRQVRISYGNLDATQKIADNLSQFPLAYKPDGSEMLYFSNKQIFKLDGSFQVLPSIVFDLSQWDYAKERRDSNPVTYNMAWQSGTSLVFLYSDGAIGGGGYIFILNSDTGRVCELKLGGWAIRAHWRSDGRYLAIVRATEYAFPIHTSDLTILDTMTGKITSIAVIPQGGKQYVDDFAWAPDNRHLLVTGSVYLSRNSDLPDIAGLFLVDFISGQSVNLSPTYKFYENSLQSNLAWSPDGSKVAIHCPAIQTIDQICLISVQKSGQ